MAARFGPDGIALRRLAAGRGERPLSRQPVDADLAVGQSCDPPLDRVDTATFAARALAERFHARLADVDVICSAVLWNRHRQVAYGSSGLLVRGPVARSRSWSTGSRPWI